MQYRIEAVTFIPELDGLVVPEETTIVSSTTLARLRCLQFWKQGFWVEVFNDATGEQIAGPLDPDEAFPAEVV